jgi:hypothetical protein
MQCNAKNRDGTQCKAFAIHGKTKCKMHGGKTPGGIASPHYKTGRYSGQLPARMASRYAESQSDAQLLELRDEVSLIDARIMDLLGRVDTGESGKVWKELKAAHSELVEANAKGDRIGIVTAMYRIGTLIGEGADDYAAWNEVLTVVEQRRRMVESERKRLVELQQTLTIEQAMLMIGALTGIIRAHVTDARTLAAISADIDKIIDVDSVGESKGRLTDDNGISEA